MTTDLLSRIAVAELVSEWYAVEASVDIVRVARDGDDAVIAARFDNSAGRARRSAGTQAAGRRTAGRSAASGSRIPLPLP